MKIPFSDLTVYEIEQFNNSVQNEISNLEEEVFSFDLSEVKKIDLCGVQFILSVNKQCTELGISFICKNINHEQLKDTFSLYNLDSFVGIEND